MKPKNKRTHKKRNQRKNQRTHKRKNKRTHRRTNKRTNRRTNKKGGELDKMNLGNLLQNPDQRISKVLQSVCKNPDNCIALGTYDNMIYSFFNTFTDFSLIDTPKTKRIGTPSANGFIWSLPFTKEGYTAYAVLKCSAAEESDNLYYEYFVGKNYINKYTKKFPCFVETYDSYNLSELKWSELYKKKSNASFASGITKNTNGFEKSCTNSKLLSVLIQHFESNSFTSLRDIYANDFKNIQYEMNWMFYQVIFALSTLGSKYTHYDLHANNVFCYKPYAGKNYIQMNYHSLDGSIVSFPSEYIMKIIDYGRNYFDNGQTNTEQILKTKICNSRLCSPDCGENYGYSIIKGNINEPSLDFYDIFPNIPNQSMDLRFLHSFKNFISQITGYKVTFLTTYGTPENLTRGIPNRKINNIHDAKYVFEHLDPAWKIKIDKKYDSTWTKAAVMNIYQDGRDYEFIQEAILPPSPSASIPIPSPAIVIPSAPYISSPRASTKSQSLSPPNPGNVAPFSHFSSRSQSLGMSP
jgi:hypothetical protein